MIMEPIIVRKAQQADIPAILEIEWECFREDSFSKEQFAYLISRSKGIFYVMMEADRVIAYVSLSISSRFLSSVGRVILKS